MIETIVLAIVSAVLYAGSAFMKKTFDQDNPQSFDVAKFGSTIVVAVVIAATMIGAGVTSITETDITTQLAVYAGLTALVENALRAVIRKIA